MIVEKRGNILNSGADIICAQVNCRGVMGSGFVKHIRKKYPKIFSEYRKFCDCHKIEDKELEDFGMLGRVLAIDVEEFCFLGLFGQNRYGKDGIEYTDYPALKVCLNTVNDYIDKDLRVAIPYELGCEFQNGDWGKVYKMIDETFKNRTVEIWRL